MNSSATKKPSKNLIALNSENFDSLILDSAVISVVGFTSSEDESCKSYDWIIDSLAKTMGDSVRIGYVNTDQDSSFLERFPIKTVPAYLFFKDADIAYLYRINETNLDIFDTLVSHLQTLKLTHRYVTTLNKRNFRNIINESKQIAMVDFFIPSCGDCQKMDRTVAEIAQLYSQKVIVGKVDLSKDDSLRYMYNAFESPTFVFFDSGEQFKTLKGEWPKDSLIKIINDRIALKSSSNQNEN
ncbi:MAG: hypothetical protein GX640_00055 [Fibrobacter sp.]|nr:hypothetical protein [Fibrobacter sp.]